MSNQHNYHHSNALRNHIPSLPSINSDPGQYHAREMGPPAPRDLGLRMLHLSSLSSASSRDLDVLPAPNPGYGDLPYGNSGIFSSDGQSMPQDRVHDWASSDSPWSQLRSVMPDVPSAPTKPLINTQYRPVASTQPYRSLEVLASDSGYHSYGTRRSVANTSVFSGDAPEREDVQSITSHCQPFVAYHEDIPRAGDQWSAPTSQAHALACPTCRQTVKTKSELKKHENRHSKPFECDVPGCDRREGFTTRNDLERHMTSKHAHIATNTKKFRCLVKDCSDKSKEWPRLDNFKSHLKRVHHLVPGDELDDLVRRGEFLPSEKSSTETETIPDLIQQPAAFALPEQPHYPSAIEPAHDLIAPKGSQPTLSSIRDDCTIIRPPEIHRNYLPESTLPKNSLMPHDHDCHDNDDGAQPDHDEADHFREDTPGPESRPQEKEKNISAEALSSESIATLTQAIKVLAAKSPRSSLPNSAPSPRSPPSHSNKPPPTSPELDDDEEARKEVAKALQLLKGLGYTVLRNPIPDPSTKKCSAGSTASQKSEYKVTCFVCGKFSGRPCELRKHMKRHDRPYGCTFTNCPKTFGSKNDWKRHENSQHFHNEMYKCTQPLPVTSSSSTTNTNENASPSTQHGLNATLTPSPSFHSNNETNEKTCPHIAYRVLPFRTHLTTTHGITSPTTLKEVTASCRIGRNCQERFWCGFCRKTVQLKQRGLGAFTERFDHIDDHFMGRGEERRWGIGDWVGADGEVNGEKGDGNAVEGGGGDGGESEVDDDRGKMDAAGSSSSSLIIMDTTTSSPSAGSKKRPLDEVLSPRPPKRSKITEKMRICCQCRFPHNPRVDTSCTTCDGGHNFCDDCRVKDVEIDAES